MISKQVLTSTLQFRAFATLYHNTNYIMKKRIGEKIINVIDYKETIIFLMIFISTFQTRELHYICSFACVKIMNFVSDH